MRSVELACMLATFGGIVWGVLRFFVPPSRTEWKTTALSAGAVAGVVNQAAAIWLAPNVPIRQGLAVFMYSGSMALFWSAVRACGRSPLTAIFEADTPVRIVATGPYRFVRHPFYLSYAIFWMAGWVGTGAWSTGAIATGMLVVYSLAARSEERKFRCSPVAHVYGGYKKGTGMLFPKVWPRPKQAVARAPHQSC